MVHLLWRTVYHILIKCSLQDRIHPRKAKMYFHKRHLQKCNNSKCKSYQPKIWKWPKCPSTNECFNGILFTQCCTAQKYKKRGCYVHWCRPAIPGLRRGCASTVSTAADHTRVAPLLTAYGWGAQRRKPPTCPPGRRAHNSTSVKLLSGQNISTLSGKRGSVLRRWQWSRLTFEDWNALHLVWGIPYRYPELSKYMQCYT